jgi:hypothetical protein
MITIARYILQILGFVEPKRRQVPPRRAPLPEARPVRQVRPAPPPPDPSLYAPKPITPPPIDLSEYLLSLTGERRRKAMRLLRHGYRIGMDVVVPAANVVPMRMAA